MSGGDSLTFETHLSSAPVSDVERSALLADPGFGRIFTDHMVTIRYTEGKGWHEARVEPYGPIPLSPATAVLHYAQEIFEGLKAYHAADGGITLFRPDANARRFQLSAERMAMPKLPEEVFLASLDKLLEVDRAWVPTKPESSLYLRPFMFASEVFLGVLRRRRQAGHHLALRALHPGRARRHRSGQVRRQLRVQPGADGRGDRGRLRPGGLPRLRRAALGRRARWDERLLRVRRRLAGHAAAHRHDPSRHHPGLVDHTRPGDGPQSGRAAVLDRRMAYRCRVRRAERGVRLRHRRRDHPDRQGALGGR